MIAFGPVPSRRLGRSLGINNIPPKQCTYSCVYCQLGRTLDKEINRYPYYEPETVLGEVKDHLANAGNAVDYLSFVPDGEPTLDVNLGRTIELLKVLSIPIAIISNASLLWRGDVKEDVGRADWVSLKIDSVDEEIWKRINRPNHHLDFSSVLRGIQAFSETYEGELVTETMLIKGMNDGEGALERVAEFITSIKPRKAYLSVPTRPPAEGYVQAPDEVTIKCANQIFLRALPRVECLTGYEGNAFGFSGNFEEDILNITAVHPLREKAVRELCKHDLAGWDRLETLVRKGQLAQVDYAGEKYYKSRWTKR